MYQLLIFPKYNVAQNLPEMQASVYGKRRVLPALSHALHLESGILGKRRLPGGNDSTAVFNDFLLAVFVSRIFYQVVCFRKYTERFLATNKHEKTRNKIK